MRVLHVLTSLNVGGIETLVCSLAAVGAAQELEMHVVVMNETFEPALMEKLQQGGARVLRMGRSPGNPLTLPWYAMKLRRAVVRIRPDVVHVHNKLGSLMATLATAGVAVPVVYTLHACRLYSASPRDRLMKAIACARTDRFTAISHAVKDDFSAAPPRPAEVAVIPNGIDLEVYAPRPWRPRPLERILCVASLKHDIKGQDILIRALRLLKVEGHPLRCDFAGTGESLGYLQALSAECGVADQVHFLGLRNDVPALLSAADLFVLPSRSEGFGIVIIEAMASAVPVIAADIDGPREIVEDGRTGLLFRQGCAEDLAAKIRLLIDDPQFGARIAEKARQASLTYSLSSTSGRFADLYRSASAPYRQPLVKG